MLFPQKVAYEVLSNVVPEEFSYLKLNQDLLLLVYAEADVFGTFWQYYFEFLSIHAERIKAGLLLQVFFYLSKTPGAYLFDSRDHLIRLNSPGVCPWQLAQIRIFHPVPSLL